MYTVAFDCVVAQLFNPHSQGLSSERHSIFTCSQVEALTLVNCNVKNVYLLQNRLPHTSTSRLRFFQPLRDKIVIYTDASCSAKLCFEGIVFFIDGQSFRLHKELQGRILRCFKSNLRIINQLELLAKLCSVLTLGSKLLQNRQVVFFCDNINPLSATVHWYSKATDMVSMTNELHLQLAKLQISAWFEWFPSLANIADLPSRVETIKELGHYKSLDIQEWPHALQIRSPETAAHEDIDSLK